MKSEYVLPISGNRNRINTHIPTLFMLLSITLGFLFSEPSFGQSQNAVTWKEAQNQDKDWYGSKEAIRIAENVLIYQHNNGGWLKNIDMARIISDKEKTDLRRAKKEKSPHTTIDNDATHTQMRYLAKVYHETGKEEFQKSFELGLEYLLNAQYENGGWPQYFPIRTGYYEHITFNDGAMIEVMELLRDIAQEKPPYGFVGEGRRKNAQKAIDKGLDIILKTQIRVDGQLTAWCAQYDKDDLQPAKARAYELPSISGGESVGIISYLMEIDQPDESVKTAVKSAVEWFNEVKIEGIKVVRIPDQSLHRGYDNILQEDPNASPLWARFYEIGTNRPMFVGRDGIVKYSLSEIEQERRVGYSYLGNYAEKLLERDFPEWKEKY